MYSVQKKYLRYLIVILIGGKCNTDVAPPKNFTELYRTGITLRSPNGR